MNGAVLSTPKVYKKSTLRKNINGFSVKWYHCLGYTFPLYIVMLTIILIPVLFGFMMSVYNIKLTTIRLVRGFGINIFAMPFVLKDQFIGLKNYIDIATDPEFGMTLLRTVIWTFVNVFFHVTIGVWLAVILNRKLPGKRLFQILLIIPWAIPQYIAANIWKNNIFIGQFGILNVIMRSMGLHEINWLGDPNMTFVACIITNIWLGFPFMMMVALGGLQTIPSELYEAADMDGSNGWQKFRYITMPLIQPIMTPSIVLGSVWTFNMINIIYLFADNGRPAPASQILVTKMYTDGLNLYRYSYASAIGVTILIILFAFSMVYMRIFQRKED